MTAELNRRILEEYRLEIWSINESEFEIWHIDSRGNKNALKPTLSTSKHEYGAIGKCSYYLIGFSHKKDGISKHISLPLHRLLYAWFKGPIPEGYDVDHIDGNSLNNSLSNLDLITRTDNILKRGGAKNQYVGGGGLVKSNPNKGKKYNKRK